MVAPTAQWAADPSKRPSAAKSVTELIRFEPNVCICNGKEFKGESVSVMNDILLTFPQICLCNGNIHSSGKHRSVSDIGFNSPQKNMVSVIILAAMVSLSWLASPACCYHRSELRLQNDALHVRDGFPACPPLTSGMALAFYSTLAASSCQSRHHKP